MSARRWLPLVAACIGTFLLLTYATITTIAVPSIASSLDGSRGSTSWIVDAYTLALAALLVGMGVLGDAWGRKRLYLTASAAFLGATVVCAVAPSITTLVVARGAQGVAAAGMFASLLPLLNGSYSGTERRFAFAVWGAVAGFAAGLRNIAGGILTQFFDWRAVFYVGIPVTLVGLILAVLAFSETEPSRVPIDWLGIGLFTAAALATVVGLTSGGESGWTGPQAVASFFVAVAAMTAFVHRQRRVAHPVLDPAMFRSSRFDGVLIAAFGYYLAAYGPLVVLSLWLQNTLGLSAIAAAGVLSIQPAAFVVISGCFGSRLQRADLRIGLGLGTVLCGLGCVALLYVLVHPDWQALVAGLVLTGVGSALVSPVLPGASMSDVPATRTGAASASANSSRQFGLAVGIAVCGSLFAGTSETVLMWPLIFCAAVGIASGALSIALFSVSHTVPPEERVRV